uniref:Zygote arrest 1 like n=1 Tax=Chelonoidis abingdonii TaxID=106734 RepID=A0A8C0GMM8_CHEAB
MERFIYPLYSVYQGYGGTLMSSQGGGLVGPKQKQLKWKQSKGRSPSLGVPITPATAAGPEPADYLDGYMWAQLKALLSQVSPGLPLRLCKANTKDLGVQVNPGWMPQCSSSSNPFSWAGPAIYSPGLDWHLFTLAAVARPQVAPPTAPERKEGAGGEQVAPQLEEEPGKRSQGADTAPSQQPQPEETEAVPQGEGAAEMKRSTFQFLEQKYGYFHCKDSKTRWESVYVWYISGSNRVYFKQLCHKSIQCQRLHRQELCGHCKGKRLFCDNTYSFKYIV